VLTSLPERERQAVEVVERHLGGEPRAAETSPPRQIKAVH
jgi:hypothetical protein